jgi:hypothetical protein
MHFRCADADCGCYPRDCKLSNSLLSASFMGKGLLLDKIESVIHILQVSL